MKKFTYFLWAGIAMIAWTVLTLVATINGCFRPRLTTENTSRAFLAAAERLIIPDSGQRFAGSFALALMKDGRVEVEKFYFRDKPVDRHTVFQVSSLSKWISATGVMRLVEQGKIELDAPVSKYLKRWKMPATNFNNDDVTVRRLLSHTAGLTDGLGYSGFEHKEQVQTLEQSLSHAADADAGINGVVSVGIPPGKEFRYSGGGYTLLQLVVEEVTGHTFSEYMKDSIFRPLGMFHSTYDWDSASTYSMADLYDSSGMRMQPPRYTSLAATSLFTTLHDLELFFQMHLTGKAREPIGRNILKPETIGLMRKPHAQKMGFDIWGLGTILYATVGYDFIIGHDGKSTPPINTAVRLNPVTGDGIIVLETGHPSLATRLASEWVFWRTGQVDTLLFPTMMGSMVIAIATGWVVIIIVSLVSWWRRKRKQ